MCPGDGGWSGVNGLHDWVMSLLHTDGPIALFLSLTLETLGLPLPGESALIAASAAAAQGVFPIWHVALAAWAGAVLGDNIGYLIGRRAGRAVVIGYGERVGITELRFAIVEEQVRKYGAFLVIAARFVVLARQLNGLVAGTVGMHWARFLVANVFGAALWVGFWTTLAYRVGDSPLVPYLWHHIGKIAVLALPLMVLLVGLAVLKWFRR